MSLTITDPYRSEFITVTEAAEELRVSERYIGSSLWIRGPVGPTP